MVNGATVAFVELNSAPGGYQRDIAPLTIKSSLINNAMPLPRPSEGEKEGDFVSRCIEMETRHEKTKPMGERRPKAQIAAMCYEEYKRKA